LEERLFIDAGEHASLLAIYLDKVHSAMVAGTIDAATWANWPLKQGWRRLTQLQQVVKKRQQRGGQSVDFVLCYCGVARSPGGGYPEMEDSLGWLIRLLAPGAAEHRGRTRVFIKEKCGEAVDAGLGEALKAALAPVAHHVEVEHIMDELRADDATAYLSHLAGPLNNDIAAWTFFLHADAPEHIHPFRLLEEVFAAVQSGMLDEDDFPFLYLSHNYLDLGVSKHTWDNYASPLLWKKLFGSSIAPARTEVKGYCCVQFLVPRRRAMLRSREWYAYAFQWFASAKSYLRLFPLGTVLTWQDVTCRAPAQLWMPWWHVAFGEDLACPERHADARLPLFIQLRSIPPNQLQLARS